MQEKYGVRFRCELPLAGQTMLDYVIHAIKHLGSIRIIGGPIDSSFERIESGKTFLESLTLAITSLTQERFLLVTGDLPFLTRAAIDDFLAKSGPEAGLNYAVIPVELCERAFPGMQRTSIKTNIGRLTGGNVAEGNSQEFRKALAHMEQAYEDRKNPMRLARKVGLGTLLRLGLGQVFPQTLPISALETAVGKVVGTRVNAVVSNFPEIGADVDDEAQYLVARTLLERAVTAKN